MRPAGPGEFTRRAVINGRMDLTAAEAVADVIAAETGAQRRQALGQLEGGLESLYEPWRTELVRIQALVEATIDFSDDDLPEGLSADAAAQMERLAARLRQHLNDARRGERLREGFQVVILGRPNAGKSTLLNALAQRDVAIVSDVSGTTRDVIDVHLDLGGYPVVLTDTAGLRDSACPVEQEGMRRGLNRARLADLRILLLDGAEAVAGLQGLADQYAAGDIVIINKADLGRVTAAQAQELGAGLVSLRTGAGLGVLLETLEQRTASVLGGGEAVPTRARHRAALEAALTALERAQGGDLPELVAEDLRQAAQALGRITGRVDPEAVLDVIFRDFCIGK